MNRTEASEQARQNPRDKETERRKGRKNESNSNERVEWTKHEK